MNSCKEPLMGFIDYYNYYLRTFQKITESDRDQLVRQIYFNIIPLVEKELRYIKIGDHEGSNRRYRACEETIIALNFIKEQLECKQITKEKTYQEDFRASLAYFDARLEYLETIPLSILSNEDFENFLAELKVRDELSEYFDEFWERIEKIYLKKNESALYEDNSAVEAGQEAIRESSLNEAPAAFLMTQEEEVVSMVQEASREILLGEAPAPIAIFNSNALPKPKDVLDGKIAFEDYSKLISEHFLNVRDRFKVRQTSYIEFVKEIGELDGYIFRHDSLKPENKEEFKHLNTILRNIYNDLKPCLELLQKNKSITPESHHRFTINDDNKIVFIGNKKSLADRVKLFFSRIMFY